MADAYGPLGGIDWIPFAPTDNTPVYLIAAESAMRERFTCDRYAPLDNGTVAFLAESEAAGALVVVLADPWSLMLATYRGQAAVCDQVRPGRAVIAVFNCDDQETVQRSAELRAAVARSLPTVAVAIRHPAFFRDEPHSKSTLRAEIQAVLSEMHLRSIQTRSAAVVGDSSPPPIVTNSQRSGATSG